MRQGFPAGVSETLMRISCFAPTIPSPLSSSCPPLILYKCEYSAASFRETARDTMRHVALGFDRYWKTFSKQPESLRKAVYGKAVTIGLRRVAALVPRLKNEAFAEEREWRLVLLPDPGKRTEAVKFRPGARGVTPYLDAPLVKDDDEALGIAEVRVGPQHDPDTAQKGAKLLLQSFGHDADKVKSSSVPYRGAEP